MCLVHAVTTRCPFHRMVTTFKCGLVRDVLADHHCSLLPAGRSASIGPMKIHEAENMLETEEDVWQRDVHPEGQGGLKNASGLGCRTQRHITLW